MPSPDQIHTHLAFKLSVLFGALTIAFLSLFTHSISIIIFCCLMIGFLLGRISALNKLNTNYTGVKHTTETTTLSVAPLPDGANLPDETKIQIILNQFVTQGVSNPTLHNCWYVDFKNEIYGPFTREEVITAIHSHYFSGMIRACRDLLDPKWDRLVDNKEFQNYFTQV